MRAAPIPTTVTARLHTVVSALAVLIAAVLLVGPGGTAHAADGAHSAAVPPAAPAVARAGGVTIVDDADVLTSSEESRIRSAASDIPSSVRLYVATADISSGDLTDWLDDEGSRVGWSGSGAASNTVILAVAPEIRKMDAHWGSGVGLDPYEEDIFSAMSPQFRNRNWGAGLIAGVQTVGSALSGDLGAGSSSGSSDSSSSGNSNSHTGWWVILVLIGIVVAINLFSKLRRRSAERRAGREEQARRDRVKGETLTTAADLRARLDQDQLLVPSIPDSPLQDQLELDLTAAQSDLRSVEANTDVDSAAKEVAELSTAVATLDRRIALLRKAPGWEAAWSEEIDAARTLLRSWQSAVTAVKDLDAAPTNGDVPAQAGTDLDRIASQVSSGAMTLEVGLGQLMTWSRTARARLTDATNQLSSLRQAAERARRKAEAEAEAKRQAEQSRYDDRDSGSGSFGGGFWSGVLVGRASNRRSGWWGGGWSGGGGWGGGSSHRSGWSGGGSSRSFGGGGGFSRGGGGFSRGGGGGGGSRSF